MTNLKRAAALILLLNASWAFTQDVPPTTGTPSLSSQYPNLVVGQPIRWRWPDGRQAILVETYGGLKDFSAGLTMTKNTCNSSAAPRCYFRSKIRQRVFGVLWEKHPTDPGKIGTPLLKSVSDSNRYSDRRSDTEIYYIETQMISALAQLHLRNLNQRFTAFSDVKDSIICENFDWMPKSSNGDFFVESWLTQFEFPAVELGMGHGNTPNANQFTTSAHEVKLELVAPNELQIVDALAIGKLFDFGGTSLALGYQTVMNFDRARVGTNPQASQGRLEWSDPQCRIEMTINLSELFTNFTRLMESDFPRPTRKNSRPLLYQKNDRTISNSAKNLIREIYQ